MRDQDAVEKALRIRNHSIKGVSISCKLFVRIENQEEKEKTTKDKNNKNKKESKVQKHIPVKSNGNAQKNYMHSGSKSHPFHNLKSVPSGRNFSRLHPSGDPTHNQLLEQSYLFRHRGNYVSDFLPLTSPLLNPAFQPAPPSEEASQDQDSQRQPQQGAKSARAREPADRTPTRACPSGTISQASKNSPEDDASTVITPVQSISDCTSKVMRADRETSSLDSSLNTSQQKQSFLHPQAKVLTHSAGTVILVEPSFWDDRTEIRSDSQLPMLKRVYSNASESDRYRFNVNVYKRFF